MSITHLVGVDEVGRGPLAGPVAVGVFAVSAAFDFFLLEGIKDSKALSPKQREAWYATLRALPGAQYAVAYSSAAHIDAQGITRAIALALARALTRVRVDPAHTLVLLDGSLRAPHRFTNQRTIVHGDATEPLISAAAILAKVTRDRHMVRLGHRFPAYGFPDHKGYGTSAHRAMIREHGLSSIHRRTFCTRL